MVLQTPFPEARFPWRWLTAALLVLGACSAQAQSQETDWTRVAAMLGTPGTDFTPYGTQPGLLHDLKPSGACSSCHGGNTESPELGFRPFATWAGSMMANATRDPLFFAALDIANHDIPGIGDYCLRCHTPRGWYGGRVVKRGFGEPDNDVTLGASACLLAGAYDETDHLDNDYGGLPCQFCHRIEAQGPLGQPSMVGNANIWLDDDSCANTGDFEPCRHGPYDYASGGPQPPHPWIHDPFVSSSAICGSCHDVSSPEVSGSPLRTLILANGTDTGHSFPIERTFSEWQQSAYADTGHPAAATCQSCHMPDSVDADATACAIPGFPDRTGNLPVHAFVGGNTWIPAVITGEYSDTSGIPGAFGGFGREESFAQTIAWAEQMLASAATVEASIVAFMPPGLITGSLEVAVKVTNLSGHKLPSGYAEGRRMWLNLQVRDANGALVFESAAYDPATAVLAEGPQTRVYEVLQGIYDDHGTGECDVLDASGRPMFHFVLNNCIAKDNRIPPLGFSPATPGDPMGYDLRPVAASYPETSPGSGVLVNYDIAPYSVVVPAGTPLPLTVFARLYYQTASREYIEFLRNVAVENDFPGENTLCTSARDPFVIGPQGRSRGEFMYQLWSEPVTGERIFADGFDGTRPQAGYGKSPPELMQFDTVSSAP